MKQKMYEHYLRFGAKRFVLITVLVLIVLDILNSYYLKLHWVQKDYSGMMIDLTIKQSQLNTDEFSPETIQEMAKFINNCFYFFIFTILANNLFFYFFYLRKKLWAQGYVLFYTITAALFSITFIFDHAGLGLGWMTYNLLTIPIYAYLYWGVKLLKKETTLVNEKKAQ